VIERNLRQIQRLEKEVEEARRERDEQAAQVPTKPLNPKPLLEGVGRAGCTGAHQALKPQTLT
jgi:hypothetical protein